jgi:hypothetical protein
LGGDACPIERPVVVLEKASRSPSKGEAQSVRISDLVTHLRSLNPPLLRYRCECGFPCYSQGQENYHRDGACIAIRRMLNVMAARIRLGHDDHIGLETSGVVVLERLSQ